MFVLQIIWKLFINIVSTLIIIKVLTAGYSGFEQIVLASLVILYTYLAGIAAAIPNLFITLTHALRQNIIHIKNMINKTNDASADEEQDKQNNQKHRLLYLDYAFRGIWFFIAIVSIINA